MKSRVVKTSEDFIFFLYTELLQLQKQLLRDMHVTTRNITETKQHLIIMTVFW